MAASQEPLSVLLVTSGFPLFPGEGLNEFMLGLATAMNRDGLEVVVLAPRSKRSRDHEVMNGIPVHRHRQMPLLDAELAYGSGVVGNIRRNPLLLFAVPFYFAYQLLAIRRLVKRYRIRIIHAHWIIPQGVVAVLFRKLFGGDVRIVSTGHGSDLLGLDHPIGNALKRWTLTNSDRVSVVSELLKSAAERHGAREVAVIPMGIDLEAFSPERRDPAVKTRFGITGTFLLYVGGLIPAKGVVDLVAAMPAVIREVPDATLVMVGEGYLLERLRQQARDAGVADHVVFAGVVPNRELPACFATADLFVLPSHTEGYSLVLREALSAGAPCVACDLPVYRRDPALFELLVTAQPGDPGDLARQMVRALAERGGSDERRQRGREYVRRTGDWGPIGAAYRELMRSVIGS